MAFGRFSFSTMSVTMFSYYYPSNGFSNTLLSLDALIASISSITCPLDISIASIAVLTRIVHTKTSAAGARGRTSDQERQRSSQPSARPRSERQARVLLNKAHAHSLEARNHIRPSAVPVPHGAAKHFNQQRYRFCDLPPALFSYGVCTERESRLSTELAL